MELVDTGIIVKGPDDEKTRKYADVFMVDADHPEMGWKITVINTLGYAMPSTGGPGTRYYSVLGVLLTALAAGFFLLRRKRR